jgi:hypothetical protein
MAGCRVHAGSCECQSGWTVCRPVKPCDARILLAPQCSGRFDAGSPPRWQVLCSQSRGHQNEADGGDVRRIQQTNAEQLSSHEPRRPDGRHHPEPEADRDDGEALSHDQEFDVLGLGAQRESDAEFAGALAYSVRYHSVAPDCAQQKSE